jgi:hypothetical protein
MIQQITISFLEEIKRTNSEMPDIIQLEIFQFLTQELLLKYITLQMSN